MLSTALRFAARPRMGRTGAYPISNWKMPAFEIDTAGISGFLETTTEPHLSFAEKLSEFTPGNLYAGLDEWSRELLVSLSTDVGCGFGLSIMVATIAIKTIFL